MIAVTAYNPAIEGLTRDRLLELQWRKLKHQLEWMHAHNGFYGDRLRAAGLSPDSITTMERFRELVPFSDKKDLLEDQNSHPPFGRRLGVREDQIAMTFLTSGTSGIGQEVYGHTWKDAILAGTKYLEGPLWWMGLRKGDRLFVMVPIATLAFGLMVTESFHLGGYQVYQAFNSDSVGRLRLMQRFKPHAFVATPAHLARLTTLAKELGIDPRRDYDTLKGILIAGQSYPVELAERLEEFWGVKLFETYGSSQGNGHLAATCELGAVREGGRRGGMHIYEHRLLLEVLDPDTWQPVQPGEEGMAVVTSIEEEGSPLLRFKTNDRVRFLGHDCACGRPWAMIEAGTLSRYDDMVKVRGMNIWPQAVDDVFFGHDEIDEYVADVKVDAGGNEVIDVRYALRESALTAMGDESRAGLRDRLVAELKDKTNVTFTLSEVARKELPVFEFKAVRWNDRRQSDLAKKVW